MKLSIADLIIRHQVKARFILVGIWNTIFGYLIFIGLDILFSRLFTTRYMVYMPAMVLANIIAIVNSYIFHKYLTFRSTVKGKGIIIEFCRFSMTYIGTISLSLVLLPLLVEIFHIMPRIAGALVISVCAIISYLGHSRFSFR